MGNHTHWCEGDIVQQTKDLSEDTLKASKELTEPHEISPKSPREGCYCDFLSFSRMVCLKAGCLECLLMYVPFFPMQDSLVVSIACLISSDLMSLGQCKKQEKRKKYPFRWVVEKKPALRGKEKMPTPILRTFRALGTPLL